jgi:hypothetical protein
VRVQGKSGAAIAKSQSSRSADHRLGFTFMLIFLDRISLGGSFCPLLSHLDEKNGRIRPTNVMPSYRVRPIYLKQPGGDRSNAKDADSAREEFSDANNRVVFSRLKL